MTKWLEGIWYGDSRLGLPLLPLAMLFRLAVSLRHASYRLGLRKITRLSVPVVVVGNISVGGTGKTPLVIWLAKFLREQGFHPGVITRGYRGRATSWPQQVRPDSDPVAVGDEAVLLAKRCGCPVAAAPKRAEAALALLKYDHCDIIISDDGLQHLALARDVEIVVIDGERRFGNGRCLPAGPLREPISRLDSVDMLVVNGVAGRGEFGLQLVPGAIRGVADRTRVLVPESLSNHEVHAVAGIGNPGKFFHTLRRLGLTPIEHPFPDHHPFSQDDITFGDGLPVIMTEKDAVKCGFFAASEHWYLPIDTPPKPVFKTRLLRLLHQSGKPLKTSEEQA